MKFKISFIFLFIFLFCITSVSTQQLVGCYYTLIPGTCDNYGYCDYQEYCTYDYSSSSVIYDPRSAAGSPQVYDPNSNSYVIANPLPNDPRIFQGNPNAIFAPSSGVSMDSSINAPQVNNWPTQVQSSIATLGNIPAINLGAVAEPPGPGSIDSQISLQNYPQNPSSSQSYASTSAPGLSSSDTSNYDFQSNINHQSGEWKVSFSTGGNSYVDLEGIGVGDMNKQLKQWAVFRIPRFSS